MIKFSARVHLLIIFVILVGIILLNILGIFGPFRTVVAYVFSPIERLFSKIGSGIGGVFGVASDVKSLVKENQGLKDKNEKFIVENAKVKELERENDILREQLAYVKMSPYNLIPAFIIAADPNNFSQIHTINRGTTHGVKKDAPVLASDGILVGKIIEADFTNAKIRIITDSQFSLIAEVQGSGADGVVRGEHGLGLIMEMIPRDKIVKKGDTIVTSGLDKNFPSKILIGEVEEVMNPENEIFQKVRIKSPINFKELESIYVIKL